MINWFKKKLIPHIQTRKKKDRVIDDWHEYYNDSTKVDVYIRYILHLPSVVKNFNIDQGQLHVRQDRSEIHVTYEKKITSALLHDLKRHFSDFRRHKQSDQNLVMRNPSRYIVGYIKETLPAINTEISRRRYEEGHLILKNISLFDIRNVFIIEKDKTVSAILWPLPLPGFEDIPHEHNVIFIRDLVDAITEYFYFNLDECVRKVITSIENYFLFYKLNPISNPPPDSKFIRQVNDHITQNFYNSKERDLKIIRENIINIYLTRNKIVHDNLRIEPTNTVFCSKAITTLLYIYQSRYLNEDGKRTSISKLHAHFKMIENLIGPNLDVIEKAMNTTEKAEVIHNPDELDESMFRGLKIKDEEKVMR